MLRWLLLLFLFIPSIASSQHLRIYAVVVGNDDPANSMAGSSLGSGLWQSDDTGRTWSQLGWKHIKGFSMDQDSLGRVLYLAAGNGVLKSSDSGASWKVMTDWRITEVMDIAIHPSKSNIILAATARGVIKSTDAGNTWKSANRGIKQLYTSRIAWYNDLLYVCGEDGICVSSNDGASWSLMPGSPGAVRAISDFKDLVIFGGDSAFGLTNYQHAISKSFTLSSAIWDLVYWPRQSVYLAGGIDGVAICAFDGALNFDGPKNVHALTAIGNKVIAGTLGDGLFISEDLITWQPLGLPKSQVWRLKTALVR